MLYMQKFQVKGDVKSPKAVIIKRSSQKINVLKIAVTATLDISQQQHLFWYESVFEQLIVPTKPI